MFLVIWLNIFHSIQSLIIFNHNFSSLSRLGIEGLGGGLHLLSLVLPLATLVLLRVDVSLISSHVHAQWGLLGLFHG